MKFFSFIDECFQTFGLVEGSSFAVWVIGFLSPLASSLLDGSFAQDTEVAEINIFSIAVERTAMESPSAANAAKNPRAINSVGLRD
jgi:hypothetical protein